MAREARKMECNVCKKDLTARKTKVASPLHRGSHTLALRAPPRIEFTIQYTGFTGPTEPFRVALCPECAKRVTYTSAGIPIAIEVAELFDIERQGPSLSEEIARVKVEADRAVMDIHDRLAEAIAAITEAGKKVP